MLCDTRGCCASAESTKGHYVVARQFYALARTVDPTTTKEEATPGEDKQRPGDDAQQWMWGFARKTARDQVARPCITQCPNVG
eukprot:948067-Lingulodinium_polyedra.AAC.1